MALHRPLSISKAMCLFYMQSAFAFYLQTFGVWNIQTAKHFGNLGRLFQSLEHNSVSLLVESARVQLSAEHRGVTFISFPLPSQIDKVLVEPIM